MPAAEPGWNRPALGGADIEPQRLDKRGYGACRHRRRDQPSDLCVVGPEVSGLPSDGGGFIPVDAYGRVSAGTGSVT